MAKTELEIRPLRKQDSRSEFSCGQPDLDRFFRDYAGQNQFRFHIAVPMSPYYPIASLDLQQLLLAA